VDTNRESGADFVDACSGVTRQLKECMEANAEYYAPLLEGAAEEEGRAEAETSEEASVPAEPPAEEAAASKSS